MGSGAPDRSRRPIPLRRLLPATAVILVLALAALTARLFVWPDLPPLPQHADAIVELGGPGIEGRDRLAIELARRHRARFLVQSTVVQEAGTSRCLPAPRGVTVLCFNPVPGTTRGEAEWIGREARSRNWSSVILVTTPDQAWRARLRLRRCFDGSVYSATSHLPVARWLVQIPYQWLASVKALAVERGC